MSTKGRLLTATGGMAVVTLASRVSGLVRDKVVVYLRGAVGFYLVRLAPVPLHTSARSLAQLSGYALVCAAAYVGLLVVLGSEEWRDARELVRRRRPA